MAVSGEARSARRLQDEMLCQAGIRVCRWLVLLRHVAIHCGTEWEHHKCNPFATMNAEVILAKPVSQLAHCTAAFHEIVEVAAVERRCVKHHVF